LTLRQAAPPPAALLTTLAVGAGSALFSTCGQALWQHGGVCFWLLLALLVEFRRPAGPSWRGDAWPGLACAGLVACPLSAALPVLCLVAWAGLRSPERAARLALAALLAYAPWACAYGLLYGTPLGPSAGQLAGGNWRTDLGEGLAGVLVSPSHG